MFDVEKLLGQMLSGGVGHKRKHKHKRESGSFGIPGVSKAQLGVGAIGLAIAAWEHYKTKSAAPASAPAAWTPGTPNQPYAPTPMPPPPPPMNMPLPAAPPAAMPAPVVSAPAPAAHAQDAQREADAAHLVRAMIAAAAADGLIDAEERAAILQRALEAGLSPQTQQFLLREMDAPASLEAIVAATRAELRAETYAAALIAISIDTDAERAYLDHLAARLQLSAEDRQRIHTMVGA